MSVCTFHSGVQSYIIFSIQNIFCIIIYKLLITKKLRLPRRNGEAAAKNRCEYGIRPCVPGMLSGLRQALSKPWPGLLF